MRSFQLTMHCLYVNMMASNKDRKVIKKCLDQGNDVQVHRFNQNVDEWRQ